MKYKISVMFICLFAACSNNTNLPSNTFSVNVLGINDFHGQVLAKNGEGGMLNLSAHLLNKIENTQAHTFILHAGDHVGASPAESALLQDEPSIAFLNVVQQYCETFRTNTCKVLGTAGNHEFDEGANEMLRLLSGGNHHKGPFIQSPWQGANYQTLSANVTYKNSDKHLLPPSSTVYVNDVPIGFIGITLDTTPELVAPGIVDDLAFKHQASTVAKQVKKLQTKGIEAIIVIVHDGSISNEYQGQTKQGQSIPKDSTFGKFINALPSEVDLVVSGHSHEFTNVYTTNQLGKQILVTQAYDTGRAYADIQIVIDKTSKDIVSSVAEIIMTNNTVELGQDALTSFQKIEKIVSRSADYANEYTQKLINTYKPTQDQISLGQFIANAHQYALKTDIAIMNEGGIRAELTSGKVNWGELFAIQPFGNNIIVRQYSGEQLLQLLDPEHIWSTGFQHDNQENITINGQRLVLDKRYTVSGNSYILNSEMFASGLLVPSKIVQDLDATINYIKLLPTPFNLSSKPKH
ncbi:bifunctional metallophosphatase/5'-nucleotidase [Paraglaciecola sp.]|uniref:bifunctional metallophosphatase/5'-nucleotidase n=1 Tax=Paraglaciecola sp. TaxID=1920173 RepID=UPI003EFA6EB0